MISQNDFPHSFSMWMLFDGTDTKHTKPKQRCWIKYVNTVIHFRRSWTHKSRCRFLASRRMQEPNALLALSPSSWRLVPYGQYVGRFDVPSALSTSQTVQTKSHPTAVYLQWRETRQQTWWVVPPPASPVSVAMATSVTALWRGWWPCGGLCPTRNPFCCTRGHRQELPINLFGKTTVFPKGGVDKKPLWKESSISKERASNTSFWKENSIPGKRRW